MTKDSLMALKRLSGWEDIAATLGMMRTPVAYLIRAKYLDDEGRMYDLIEYLSRRLRKKHGLRARHLACAAIEGHLKGYTLEDWENALESRTDAITVFNGPGLWLSYWNDAINAVFRDE